MQDVYGKHKCSVPAGYEVRGDEEARPGHNHKHAFNQSQSKFYHFCENTNFNLQNINEANY